MRTLLACLPLLSLACGGPPPGEPPPPDAGPEVLSLSPGEVAELTVQGGVAGAQLSTPGGAERFLLIVGSTRLDGSKASVPYSVVTGEAQQQGPSAVLSSCSLGGAAWQGRSPPREAPPTGAAVAVGAARTLNLSTPTGPQAIAAKAVAVGKTAVVWADVTVAHPANLDAAFIAKFLSDFDDLILPRERGVYGVESDLDGDGRVGIVFTPLTYQTGVAFFTGCDLANLSGCPATNHGEYLYLTPPDAIEPPYNTPEAIKETLAHELGHLLHFNRKVLRNQATTWADSGYMIEGIGGFTQDFSGYQAGNFYVAKAGLDLINQFSLAETLIDRRPYDRTRDGALRGGSYWFVRWLYDRAGGDVALQDGTLQSAGGPALFRELVDARPSVARQLPVSAGAAIEDLAMDFYTALGISNRDAAGGVAPKNPCFAFLPTQTDPITARQRGGSTFASFHGMQMTGPASRDMADERLLPGGVEYVRLSAEPGQPALALTVTVDESALPRVRVARLK